MQKILLNNGVRVLIDSVTHVKSASVGLWCKTGSRHELPTEAGITHLIEHMLFKGTKSRTAKDIASEIEGRGGSLNAFTDKESTCYYCRVLMDDTAHGIEVLCDMVRNSLFEPVELEREEKVVLEEIKRSEDEPSDHVHDLHLQKRWPGHPLGLPILGTPESVAGFKPDDIRAYMDRRYRAENVILSVAGNVDAAEILEAAEKGLGGLLPGAGENHTTRPAGVAGTHYVAKDVEQVHFCIGTDGATVYDEDYYDLVVLDAILGGSMSSRLFQVIREERGLVYAIGSYLLTYQAGGAFNVYGGTSRDNWAEVQQLVAAEFQKVQKEGVTEEELERVRRNLAGGLVLGLEGMSGRMMRMAKNEINHGRDIPIDETLLKLNAVTPAKIIAIAEKVLNPDRIGVTAIGPAIA